MSPSFNYLFFLKIIFVNTQTCYFFSILKPKTHILFLFYSGYHPISIFPILSYIHSSQLFVFTFLPKSFWSRTLTTSTMPDLPYVAYKQHMTKFILSLKRFSWLHLESFSFYQLFGNSFSVSFTGSPSSFWTLNIEVLIPELSF